MFIKYGKYHMSRAITQVLIDISITHTKTFNSRDFTKFLYSQLVSSSSYSYVLFLGPVILGYPISWDVDIQHPSRQDPLMSETNRVTVRIN